MQQLRGAEQTAVVQQEFSCRTAAAYEAEIRLTAGKSLRVQFGTDGVLTWDGSFLILEFGASGCNRPMRQVPLERLEQLRLFCDTSSVEIFANEGEAVFTSRFYADAEQSKLTVQAEQAEVHLWEMQPFYVENLFSGGKQA